MFPDSFRATKLAHRETTSLKRLGLLAPAALEFQIDCSWHAELLKLDG
jgi:hypothetical protein